MSRPNPRFTFLRTIVPLFGIALAIAFVASSEPAGAAEDTEPPAGRPNIVLILADDLGYECLTANGGRSYQTPVLDKLAQTGVRFEHCYAQPVCTPTRVELLTGLYNQRNYVRFGLLDPRARTFPQLFREAGYATCVAGKWQLSGGFDGPAHFGFDEYCLWQLTVRASRYPNPVLERDGKVITYGDGEYGPDVVSDYLCDFITRHKDEPFFAFYPMILTHWPFEPTPDSSDWDPQARGVLKGQGEPKYFADMVSYMDRMVGKVVARLDALGLREKTLIIFTGDNGTAAGIQSRFRDGTVIGAKGSTTDAGTHVPLVVNWPGVARAGQVRSDLVDFTDFLPTLLEAAGIDVPADLPVDGRSFLPQVRGENGRPREWIYAWYSRNGGPTGVEFARDQRFKLYGDGRLFDAAADTMEKNPLDRRALDATATAARAKLQAAIDGYRGTRPAEIARQGRSASEGGSE